MLRECATATLGGGVSQKHKDLCIYTSPHHPIVVYDNLDHANLTFVERTLKLAGKTLNDFIIPAKPQP